MPAGANRLDKLPLSQRAETLACGVAAAFCYACNEEAGAPLLLLNFLRLRLPHPSRFSGGRAATVQCANAENVKVAQPPDLPTILLVGDLLHPVDHLAVLPFLNGYVRHRGRRSGPVPVLLAGGEPHHIAGTDLLDGSAFALRPAAASRDDESLAERVRVPCRTRTRLEGDAGTLDQCRVGRLKKR